MASGDLLGVGVSGLLAFQRNLATISHNVSNVNTEGYSRQRVEMGTRTPQATGGGFVGTGVQVNTVSRVFNDFLGRQLQSATTQFSQSEVFHTLAREIDNLVADPRAGLAPALERFFSSVQAVANAPSSIPARQVMLSEAGALDETLSALNQRIDSLRARVSAQVNTAVAEINEFAQSIAKLNSDIVVATGSIGQPPNDLLDQRDLLVRKLGEKIGITTVPQDDGALNVFIGSGQSLVLGVQSFQLRVVQNEYDVGRPEVAYVSGPNLVLISDSVTGGEIGGLLNFRSSVLDSAQNALGRIAVALTDQFNAQHRLGQDLTGGIGTDFFDTRNLSGTLLASRNNTGTATLDFAVADVTQLSTSDYLVSFNAGTYTFTRLSDGATTTSAGLPATVDGVTVTLAAGGPANGDSFLLRPTREGSSLFGVTATAPSAIAAAAPVRAGEITDANGLALNAGTGRIGSVSVANLVGVPLAATYTLTFSAATNQFTAVPAGGPFAFNPAVDSGGRTYTFNDPAFGDIQFTISGVPADGDAFVIERNVGGTGDNRNGLLLAGLNDRNVLDGGTTDLQGAYGRLVADIGTRTRTAEITRDANKALLDRTIESYDAISGVNLDEEAANLIKFQQAYQAAAQVIGIADTLFQTLLNAVRR